MNNYQLNYAAKKPQMYDQSSREQKARRIIKLLENYYKNDALNKLTVLDIGASTGIIDHYLANYFKRITGIDIDREAIAFAKKNFKKKNLIFQIRDAMKLDYKDNSFDIVICTHIYEHVPDAKKLFDEILRVLKPSGVCYLAAINRLWPWEPHYNLPFLSWFPKTLANFYIHLSGRAKEYYENPKTYWGLKRLTKKFKVIEYTQKIFRNPKKFGYHDSIPKSISSISYVLSPLAKYFAPTFFWLLIKNE